MKREQVRGRQAESPPRPQADSSFQEVRQQENSTQRRGSGRQRVQAEVAGEEAGRQEKSPAGSEEEWQERQAEIQIMQVRW